MDAYRRDGHRPALAPAVAPRCVAVASVVLLLVTALTLAQLVWGVGHLDSILAELRRQRRPGDPAAFSAFVRATVLAAACATTVIAALSMLAAVKILVLNGS